MAATKTHTGFFYGTLMAPTVLQRVTAHDPHSPTQPLRIRPAALPGFTRRRVRFADYPAIIPVAANTSSTSSNGNRDASTVAADGEVRGTLVDGLTDRDIWRLDIFEGSEYERRDVRVRVLPNSSSSGSGSGQAKDGEWTTAQTYVWIAPEADLEDTEWDFEQFRREKLWMWDGVSEAPSQGASSRVDAVRYEDSGFEDVQRAVKESEQSQTDPTRGRSVNGGGFEKALGND